MYNKMAAALLQLIGDVASVGQQCKDPEAARKLFIAIADASANALRAIEQR